MDLSVDTAVSNKDVSKEVANVQSGDEQTTVKGNAQMIMQEVLEENAGAEKGFAKDEWRGDSELACKDHEEEPKGGAECQLSGESDPVLGIIKNEDVEEDTTFRADHNIRSEHHEGAPKVNMGSDLSDGQGLGLTTEKPIKNDDVHGETIEADRNVSPEDHKGTSKVEKNCHESGEKEDPGVSKKISIKNECMKEETMCSNRSCSCEDHDGNHEGGTNGGGDPGLIDTKSCVFKVDDMKGMDIPDVKLSSKGHVDNLESSMPGRFNGDGLTNHPRIPKEDEEDENDFDDRKLSLDDPDDHTKGDEEYGGEDDLEDVLQSGESFWCSLCDDGGNLLFCDGPCLRSFHACLSQQEKEEGKDCITLGFTEKQFKAIESEMTTWLCPNCEACSQLCFICGKLGKSAGPKKEVFNCDAAHCGQFYHPMCVARALTKNISKQREYADKIGQGVETFLCPLHKCKSCKQLEDGTDRDMQFAKCRRCPTSWHVKCLPSTMSFEDDEYLDIPQRAWRVPVGDEEHQFRVGVYCPKHELPLEPSDMVRFPYSPVSYFKLADHITSQQEALSKKLRKPKAIDHPASEKEKPTSAKERRACQQQSAKVKIYASESTKDAGAQVQGSSDVQEPSARQLSSEPKQRQHRLSTVMTGTYIDKVSASQLSDIQKRIDEIVLRSQELMTAEKIKQELRTPRYYGDKRAGPEGGKFIHDGELSSILNSIPKALNCLTKGSGIAEAKCLCPVKSIIQLDRVEKALTVYLNPCLHGQRYTSFGRHFTVKNKLIETVDRLQWYINDKDVIVDFCCGANDFSVEVRRKLILAGKKHCEYKNFDILAPKNGFQFEQRDWFSVQQSELPIGDKLIIGLNPPFGVRSSIANSFIDRAVTFRPKIIILIVPPETKRLESSGYELIWVDADLLRGKSFYLPGSVNTGDAMLEDWNKTAPPLYLWSRSDWADKHRQMAVKQGHVKAMVSALQNQQNGLSPCCQPRDPAFNPDFKPVKEMVSPSSRDSSDLRSLWSGHNVHYYRAEPHRPLPEHENSTSRLSFHFSAPHTNERLNKNPLSRRCALAPMSNPTSCSILQESPENPVKDSAKEFPHPRSEDAPTKAVADVESNDVKKPIGETLMSNKPDKSKSEPQTRTSAKRPLKTDGTSEKGNEQSKQTPRPKKQLKRAHPSSMDEAAHGPNLQTRENSHSSEALEEPLLNVVHRCREEGNNRRNSDFQDAKGRGEACDRKGNEASESSREIINMSDRRSTRNPEIGHDTLHREDRTIRRSGNERGRPCEGEAKVYQDPKEKRRSVGSGEKRALVNSREENDKDPSARKPQDSNGVIRNHNDFDKMRKSVDSHDVIASSDPRVKRSDDEDNHRNLKDFVKTTLCVDELVIRPKHEVFDVEKDPKRKDRDDGDKHKSRRGSHGNREEMAKDHSRRGIHGRDHGEKLHARGLGGREDADKGNSRKAMHGREEITEKVHSKTEIFGRVDAEKGQGRRGIPERTEAYEDHLRIRELRGREDGHRGHSRRDSHGWEDAEKTLPRKPNYVREDIDKGHPRDARELGVGKGRSKRDFNGLEQIHEHGSGRILGPAVITKTRKFEAGEGKDQRDTGNLGDFEKQNWRNNLRRFDDVVDVEAAGSVRGFQGKGPPYCTGEQTALAGLTLPKWFTTQSNTGSLLDVGHPGQDVALPSAVEAEHLETDTIKYPTLHGSYGVLDPSTMPTLSTRYPDFNQARSYGVHEQSPPRTNYSDNYGMDIHSYDTHALDFGDIQGIRPLSPASGLHSLDLGNLSSGRMYGVHHDSSSWRPPIGAADHINHQPQEMSLDWPRLDTNPHLYQDNNMGGITGSLAGAQLDPLLYRPFDDGESLASRSNYNPDQFSFGARDNHLSGIGGVPPRSSHMSNDFLGTRNSLVPSSEGLWSSTPFSFPSQSANMGSQNMGTPSMSWREPRPYLNF